MRNLVNPKWILLVNTVPLLLLALLCYGEFSVIHTLLPPESVALWQWFGLAVGGLGLGSLLYAGWAWRQGKPLTVGYAGVTLLAYSLWLGLYTYHSSEILPWSIPRWMVPTDILVYVWTFVIPTLAHALLVLVVRTTPEGKEHSVAASIGLAFAVPFGWYVLLVPLGGLWVNLHLPEALGIALLVSAIAVSPIIFLYFVARIIYILVQRREDKEFGLAWKVMITIVLPVLGLLVNAGFFWGGLSHRDETGIFGNFSSPWFYGLAVLNGLLLCLPTDGLAARWRLALLLGRSALLGYTAYFFLVFLPWLPFSVLAIIAIGTGFLMLAPLMLLVVHLYILGNDLAALRPYYSPLVRRAALLGGVAVLPLAVTATYWHERRVLHEALEYTYSPDYAKKYDLDADALFHTLTMVSKQKSTRREFVMGGQQPYLSAYFNWLVLDNLLLPDTKIVDLEKLFIGPDYNKGENAWTQPWRWTPASNFAEDQGPGTQQPELRQLTARSTFDAKEQAWVSWVDMEIANTNSRLTSEYSTTITLPPGCWVGDYYLDIGQHREPGILAERKAATWIYTQIVNERTSRDPGLLSYIGPNVLSLRVYPVVGGEARRTGIQLLHKEPLSLTIDGRSVQLGTPAAAPLPAAPIAIANGSVVYLSAQAKRQLPLVKRQPYYHFLLDVSAGQEGRKAEYVQRVQRTLRAQPLAGKPRFSLVNTYTTPVPAGTDWRQALTDFHNAGGCYLTGAVRRTLTASQMQPAATYPKLVIVTDSLTKTVLATDFADLRAAYPESDQFYVLLPSGQLEAHSLRQASANALPTDTALVAAAGVRAWPTAAHAQAYLPDSEEAAIVLPHPEAGLAVPTGAPTRWATGLLLHGFGQWQTLHPEAAEQAHLPFIQASFQANILTPLTAFLVLENDAQKAALRRKQSEVLAANLNLDAQETEPPHPDSPTAVPLNSGQWLLLLLGLGLGVRQLRQRRWGSS